MKIAICIDYDNLHPMQKITGILSIVTSVLQKMQFSSLPKQGVCHIRLYGGWFEGQEMSQLSQQISIKMQEEFPALIRVTDASGKYCSINTTVELAVSLLEEPNYHLFNTYRKKSKAQNIRVESQERVGCSSSSCPIPVARKMLKTGKCSIGNCTAGDQILIYRHEQKIVDTMLTCDLIYLSQQDYDELLIISEDDDFLPPIRTIALRGSKIIRVHPKFSSHRVIIDIAGQPLSELEI